MEHSGPLRRGWTTGACATAAAGAAFEALLTGAFPDPVSIPLPGGGTAAFALAETSLVGEVARAGVVKDAGDDPDVTHGALVRATVRRGAAGSGIVFRAGEGVGMVTRPGLPIPPGEPAINPVPRRMMVAAIGAIAARHGERPDAIVEIAIPGGAALAERTLNARLGVLGGLSILGTTGIVVPYSCAAWIDTIHRGIDVARASGLDHVAGATGRSSEAAVQRHHALPDAALIDMGDFVGGMLKYLRRHSVARVTLAGGVAKLTMLAQGRLDLHSARGSADMAALAALVSLPAPLAAGVAAAGSVAEAFALARAEGVGLGDAVAAGAWRVAAAVLDPADVALEVLAFDREGGMVGQAGFAPVHAAPLNRRT